MAPLTSLIYVLHECLTGGMGARHSWGISTVCSTRQAFERASSCAAASVADPSRSGRIPRNPGLPQAHRPMEREALPIVTNTNALPPSRLQHFCVLVEECAGKTPPNTIWFILLFLTRIYPRLLTSIPTFITLKEANLSCYSLSSSYSH